MNLRTVVLSAGIFVVGSVGATAQTAEQYLQKCDASYGKEKYADAVKHCTKAIEAKPGYEEALMARAAAYEKLGNDGAAIADYTDLISLTNGMAMFYFYRAGIYQKLSSHHYALSDLTAAIEKEPAGRYAARSHYQRGVIYDQLGKGDAAQSDYGMAVKLDPKMSAAKERLKSQPTLPVPVAKAQPVRTHVPEPTPLPRVTPSLPAVSSAPKPTPSPSPQYRPPTPAVVQTVKTTPAAAVHEPHVGDEKADAMFQQGLAHFRNKKPDLALTSFRQALARYSATESDPVVNLLITVDKANIYEQIAAAQLAKGETDNALATYKSSLKECFTSLSAAHASVSKKKPKSYGDYADIAKVLLDADIAMFGMVHPSGVKINALGKRYMAATENAKLTTEQMMRSLEIGFLKLGAGEITAMTLQTTANMRLTAANFCRTTLAHKCGPSSPKNEVNDYAAKALADMDQAIAITSALKDNYVMRAKVYRFMGRADLAAADEAKAASMK